MGKYTKQNLEHIKDQLTAYWMGDVAQRLIVLLDDAATETINYKDAISTEPGHDGLPVFTGAMHDATGIGIYYNGILVGIRKPERLYNLKPNYEVDFNPDTVLDVALKNTGIQTNNGIWIVLFSSAPYAMEVDIEGSYAKTPRGVGFFSEMIVPFFEQAVTTRIKSFVL
jgi:hypothetical protein